MPTHASGVQEFHFHSCYHPRLLSTKQLSFCGSQSTCRCRSKQDCTKKMGSSHLPRASHWPWLSSLLDVEGSLSYAASHPYKSPGPLAACGSLHRSLSPRPARTSCCNISSVSGHTYHVCQDLRCSKQPPVHNTLVKSYHADTLVHNPVQCMLLNMAQSFSH